MTRTVACAVVVALGCFHTIVAQPSPDPDEPAWVSRLWTGSIDSFPSLSEGEALLDEFVADYPTLIRKTEIGASFQGRTMYAYVVTGNTNDGSFTKDHVLITSLHHAREAGTLSTSLYFIGKVCDQYQNGDPRAVYLLNTREVWVVPFVNPDGYVAVDEVDRFVRKNRRPTCSSNNVTSGVDLNRNYASGWGTEREPCSETFGGSAAFSEPETQAIKSIADETPFKVSMDLHSYGEVLVTPISYDASVDLPPDDNEVFRELAEVFGFDIWGPASEVVGYSAGGSSVDWHYETHGTFAMTPELGPAFYWPQDTIYELIQQNYRRLLHSVHKAGLELRQVTVDSSEQGGISISLRNAGLSTSHGEKVTIGYSGCTEGTVVATAGQIESRNAMTTEASCTPSSGSEHVLCVLEDVPTSISPALCRCAKVTLGTSTNRTEFTTPEQEATCDALVNNATRSVLSPVEGFHVLL